jgi:hypothetical protein
VNIGELHQREMVSLRWAPHCEEVQFTKVEWDAAVQQAETELHLALKRERPRDYSKPGYHGHSLVLYRAKEILFLRRQL